MNNKPPAHSPGTQLTLPFKQQGRATLPDGLATVEINVWNRKTGESIMHEVFQVTSHLALEFQSKMAAVLHDLPGRHSVNLVRRVGQSQAVYILDLELNQESGPPELSSGTASLPAFSDLFRRQASTQPETDEANDG